jgi:hypothetical protein
MKRKWQFFIGAVILGGYVLLSYGAPPLALIGGICLAAAVTARSSRFA